jgi:hypothetical protein
LASAFTTEGSFAFSLMLVITNLAGQLIIAIANPITNFYYQAITSKLGTLKKDHIITNMVFF